MKFGIVVFPGSNGDHDVYHVVKHVLGHETAFLWHGTPGLAGCDALVLPGGFAHGDYLRPGALARHSPIMREVVAFARRGGPVLGICNGFQVLLEAGLLPGAMQRNRGMRFVCRDVHVRVDGRSNFTKTIAPGSVLRLPIAHAEGCWTASPALLESLEKRGQIALRYCDAEGRVTDGANPNGSVGSVAGITNEEGNVLGLMPHPERAAEALLGNTAGRAFFEAMVSP